MSADIHIRKEGRAGRITLTRPKALNALSYDMATAIEAALDDWRDQDDVALILIDATGDKAFCAGGDIQQLYDTGRAGDYDFGRRFWADEYRLNAKIAHYPKPYVALMQGFVMGGGVGISCHGSHRVTCESTQIAMPECGIGLVPDVGGSLILARAPGRLGEYLGTTGSRMGPDDAIHAGFADTYVPELKWPTLTAALVETGDPAVIAVHAETPAPGALRALSPRIDRHFGGETLHDILNALRAEDCDFARDTLKLLSRNSPLSMACAIEMIHRLRGPAADITRALGLEYRFTYRAMEQGDFLEGIRAAIIDKDRKPNWKHGLDSLPGIAVAQMLQPLGKNALTLEETGT
ncbi:Enoyl-CoA hydratase/carnithine racemase [Roseovarius mucosus DSM 17069]|uniref:3-hydroxyisobutyryl-CoA hydrolase n=1 Tax=Roseovarius mucosus DSM 17069 TaxID=1288298 RepID=A0A0A0HIX4_9RHOB|nr:enoyl-CoA hydratase/isomerase family protein [Roseovarius mucosus]KGM86634.1 Enoyl-CoA hydratase/carnithine racemase [Roseovarius mucosus DSM 17069]